jgi:hypothetical protein
MLHTKTIEFSHGFVVIESKRHPRRFLHGVDTAGTVSKVSVFGVAGNGNDVGAHWRISELKKLKKVAQRERTEKAAQKEDTPKKDQIREL